MFDPAWPDALEFIAEEFGKMVSEPKQELNPARAGPATPLLMLRCIGEVLNFYPT